MRLSSERLLRRTAGPGFTELTGDCAAFVARVRVREGQLLMFCRHTSASLLITENADPDVRADLEAFMTRLAPPDERLYRHRTEGPDDMPAHIRAALTQTSLTIPVLGGRLGLGTWQGIYLWEHRAQGAAREILLQALDI